jgi:acyl-CoA dehydrogenase
MRLELTPEDSVFRAEVREFLEANLTMEMRRGQAATATVFPEPAVNREWHRRLHARGWAAPMWPGEWGGTGWSPAQRMVFEAECARAGAPILFPIGLRLVGPVLLRYGTQAQKQRFLPPILANEDTWCQGYSEPGAGSDLAALRTLALREGEHYVVTGAKIWTTHAHHANRMFALVRTSTEGKPQQGITFLLLDMDSPGVIVRPIRTLGGDHEVNEVFLDSVRVPVANRVGEEGQGWEVAKYLLEFERGGGIVSPRLRRLFAALAGTLREAGTRPEDAAGERLATLLSELDALEMLELRAVSDQEGGRAPGAIAPLLKLRASEIRQALHEARLEALGPAALRLEERRPLDDLQLEPEETAAALAVAQYLNGRAFTIFGGTSEVQLGLLARQALAE